ncbi:MAG TPA: radical SAM protein, partial [Actinobacteria bacterium]|nr:radical SAM protein [Actinomycetota bacterium]
RPARDLLPPLEKYARLALGDEQRLVGAVEASHGCLHMCRHCPIPSVYEGRLRIVDVGSVLADIDQHVEAGARHITFGDPDFLNGPAHSLRIVRALHERHPDLTFDCTVKVEHILRDEGIWQEFAESGCLFVVSAFETMNDQVLALLDKGHTADDAARAVHVLRDVGIDLRPSWLPFTPWTTHADIERMFRFISSHDLIDSTDPVQLGIRLLIPEGSLILQIPEMEPYLGSYDPEALSYMWKAADPEMDRLATNLVDIAEVGATNGEVVADTFLKQWLAVVAGSDFEPPPDAIDQGATTGRPKLTEPWFC